MSSQKPSFLLSSISSMLLNEIEDSLVGVPIIDKTLEVYCFNEEKYIEENPKKFSAKKKALLRSIPTKKAIFDFFKSLKLSVDASDEEVLCGYIYINRLLNNANVSLTPTNWRFFYYFKIFRLLLFTSLLVSQKFLRDLDSYDLNKFYYETYSFCSLEEIGELELNFMKLLEFKLFISNKTFTKYSIELDTYSNQKTRHETYCKIPSFNLIKYTIFKTNWKIE